jgi:hypothetical protein
LPYFGLAFGPPSATWWWPSIGAALPLRCMPAEVRGQQHDDAEGDAVHANQRKSCVAT